MMELEQFYKESILAAYSDISFARLSNPGELIDRSFSLKDIFCPTKMTPLQEYQKFRIRTAREDDEFINKTELRNENSELIEEILSLLTSEHDAAEMDFERERKAVPERIHEVDSEFTDNVDSDYLSLKQTSGFSNDLLADMILADIAEILSEKNKLDNDIENAIDRRMIVGKPGSGKSTYIRRLALAYASGEKDFLNSCGYNESIFPVFVQFKRLSGVINERPDFIHVVETDFVEFLYHATCFEFTGFGNEVSLKAFGDLIDEKISTSSLLIVVDSFDEIGEEARYIFTKSLREFLNNNSNLLICSREESFDLSYSREVKSRVTEELFGIPLLMYQNIYDLTDREIKEFVKKWFDVVFKGDENNKVKVDRIVRSLYSHQSPYLRKIQRIPLYLSNILCIARNTGEIPKSKDEVLEKFVELCLNSSVNENNEYDNLKKQLAYLAYSMTVKTKKTISETELRDILIESYSELDGSFNPEIPKTNVDEYIKWVLLQWSRGDIFKVCRNYDGENIYQFEHLLFQEYFTAYAISKLYCPNVNRRTQPIDILEPYFKEINGSGWREIILMVALMEKQRWGAEEYVEKLISLVNQEDDNYYYSNMLFEIVLSNTNMSRDVRYNVYRTLFGEHITDRQIHDVCDGVDNNSLSNEFLLYVKEGFEKSISTENIEFQFVYAVIQAEMCINSNINPMKFAADILLDHEISKRILGLYMMCVIAWCRYNNIVTKFTECECRINEDIVNGFADCLSSENDLLVEATSAAIKDMVIAGYFDDNAEYWWLIVEKCKSELPNAKKQKFIRKIVSVLPINYSSVLRLQDVMKKEIGDEIITNFDECYSQKKIEGCVDSFVECALAHRWNYSNGNIHEIMRDIQALVLSSKGLDDGVKIRTRQIYRQISGLPNPVAAGISEYESRHFENAKDDFVFAVLEGLDAKTNLGYMLRRKEIKSVYIDNHDYSVEELLENGINHLDPTALMNNALLLSYNEGKYDYEIGKKYLGQFEGQSDLGSTFYWWNDQAQNGDQEGYVVLLWLLDLKEIDEEQIGKDRTYVLAQLDSAIVNLPVVQ